MKLFIYIVTAFLILGLYTRWYGESHAVITLDLHFEYKYEEKLTKKFHLTQLNYLDAEKKTLARGIYNENQRRVLLLNSNIINVESCTQVINTIDIYDVKKYDSCFNNSNVDAFKWKDEVKTIQVQHSRCITFEVPASIYHYKIGVLMDILPLPHGGTGFKPDTYQIRALIRKNDCIVKTENLVTP